MKDKILYSIIIILFIVSVISITIIFKGINKDKSIICYKDICVDNIRKVCFPNE